jgi:hypothetical protein
MICKSQNTGVLGKMQLSWATEDMRKAVYTLLQVTLSDSETLHVVVNTWEDKVFCISVSVKLV